MYLSGASSGPRIVVCPGCHGPSVFAASNRYRPFCSERCKNHDFGAWASEGYRVEAPAARDEHDADDGTSPPC